MVAGCKCAFNSQAPGVPDRELSIRSATEMKEFRAIMIVMPRCAKAKGDHDRKEGPWRYPDRASRARCTFVATIVPWTFPLKRTPLPVGQPFPPRSGRPGHHGPLVILHGPGLSIQWRYCTEWVKAINRRLSSILMARLQINEQVILPKGSSSRALANRL